jgi:hypothetical protein
MKGNHFEKPEGARSIGVGALQQTMPADLESAGAGTEKRVGVVAIEDCH